MDLKVIKKELSLVNTSQDLYILFYRGVLIGIKGYHYTFEVSVILIYF